MRGTKQRRQMREQINKGYIEEMRAREGLAKEGNRRKEKKKEMGRSKRQSEEERVKIMECTDVGERKGKRR